MSDEAKLYRCMGGSRCNHTPGTCTATNAEYQAKAKAKQIMTNHEPKRPPADMAGLDGLIERLQNTGLQSAAEAATQLQALKARVKVLEAENERLREALKGVLAHRYGEWCGIARAALKGAEG